MYITYIHFNKAFDNIDTTVRETPCENYSRIVEFNFKIRSSNRFVGHEPSTCQVVGGACLTDHFKFNTLTGIHQGYLLSSITFFCFLFIATDWIYGLNNTTAMYPVNSLLTAGEH